MPWVPSKDANSTAPTGHASFSTQNTHRAARAQDTDFPGPSWTSEPPKASGTSTWPITGSLGLATADTPNSAGSHQPCPPTKGDHLPGFSRPPRPCHPNGGGGHLSDLAKPRQTPDQRERHLPRLLTRSPGQPTGTRLHPEVTTSPPPQALQPGPLTRRTSPGPPTPATGTADNLPSTSTKGDNREDVRGPHGETAGCDLRDDRTKGHELRGEAAVLR
nr:mucin-7-like isoform X1 [Peromyscus maniculatus bairdii]